MPKFSNHYGNNARLLRELNDIKAYTIYSKLGISQNAYSRWETGRVEIDDDKKQRIADAIGVTVGDIEDFDRHPFYLHNRRDAASTHYHHLAEEVAALKAELALLQAERDAYRQENLMVRKENLYLRKMAFGEVEDMVGVEK